MNTNELMILGPLPNMLDAELNTAIKERAELLRTLVPSIVEDELVKLREERRRRMPPTKAPTSTVWKYTLATLGVHELQVPAGGMLLSVGVQGGDIVLWAHVNPQRDKLPRRVRVAATGEAFEGRWRFLGTVQMSVTEPTHTHQLVFHVFEEWGIV